MSRKITKPAAAAALLLVVVIAVAPSCTTRKTAPITLEVFCGSAVKPAVDEAAAVFNKRTGIVVKPIYGGSGEVLSQMELSRRGDIYIAGSPDFMIKARRKRIVRWETEKTLAYLVPAIIVRKGNPKNIKSLADLTRPGITVGIGRPESVCVGTYAVEIFEKNRLTRAVGPNIKAVVTSCSAVASLIAMKKIDAIIGWRDFQAWSPDASEIVPLKPGEAPRVAFVAAAISTFSKHPEEAEKFLDFLASERGRAAFHGHGGITSREQALKLAPGASIGGEYTPKTDELFRK